MNDKPKENLEFRYLIEVVQINQLVVDIKLARLNFINKTIFLPSQPTGQRLHIEERIIDE